MAYMIEDEKDRMYKRIDTPFSTQEQELRVTQPFLAKKSTSLSAEPNHPSISVGIADVGHCLYRLRLREENFLTGLLLIYSHGLGQYFINKYSIVYYKTN